MDISLSIPDYEAQNGLVSMWDHGFEIEVKAANDEVHIRANRAGLISLAKQFLALADESVPSGYHLHFDAYNSLETGSSELIVEKM